ncbi:hypothetical protein G7085_01665 [Tessaracoccus sp. HDW20]|uniref:hypothetical protein n=1 Tax=Tessaracoccus coleopterorum TaxID=2714950 RepID=UPI0018D46C1C|nr:hypothetical protein [Tessaracoccus coleopterorum]NHB83833.1 hypothetical protein [Tessaracoccus coleopterorum]
MNTVNGDHDATDALLAYANLNRTVDASILMVVHDLHAHLGTDPDDLIALMCGSRPPQHLTGLPPREADRLRGILVGRHAGALKRDYASRYRRCRATRTPDRVARVRAIEGSQ